MIPWETSSSDGAIVAARGTHFSGSRDFDADGHKDLVAAHRGGPRLWLLAGTGEGSFLTPGPIDLPAGATSLVVGEIQRADGLEDLVVGVADHQGAGLLIFQTSSGALAGKPQMLSFSEEIRDIAIGRLDSAPGFDIAFTSGNRLGVLYGTDDSMPDSSEIEWHDSESPIEGLALGDFSGDSRNELALLA